MGLYCGSYCVHACVYVCVVYVCVCVCIRPQRLIDLIVNRDYWETIDVQTIIVMSYFLKKYNQKPDYAGQFGAKYNV